MRLTMDILQESVAMNAGTLLADSSAGQTTVAKHKLTALPLRLLSLFGKGVTNLVRGYALNQASARTMRDTMLKQGIRVHHRYPAHLWKRHSALLTEAQRCKGYRHTHH